VPGQQGRFVSSARGGKPVVALGPFRDTVQREANVCPLSIDPLGLIQAR